MKSFLRGMAALTLVAAALPVSGLSAQDKAALSSERDRISYMVGADVGASIMAVGPDIDLAALRRAIENAFAGNKPLLDEETAKSVAPALMQRIAQRQGQAVPGAPPGTPAPSVSKEQVGYLVGADIGRSLAPIRADLDLGVFMRGLGDVLGNRPRALDEAAADALRKSFSERVQARLQKEAAEAGARNSSEGAAFLARNKAAKGVFTTPSGLQYMVIRQGAGARPRPTDRVRVHYKGTLLDGTVFDSSYDRATPAEFGLDQVIAGWTEGVAMMPVGAKYRFWVPAELAYGAKGMPGAIGPNSTLVFDVELLQVL